MGADAVVDPSEVASVVAELSQGRGVDTFIETSGAPPALQTAITNTGERGSVVVPAWYGTRPVSLSLSPEFHRSEEHTSELQSLMRISYAVFCLKKKKTNTSKKSLVI